jgi:hypothetical protein
MTPEGFYRCPACENLVEPPPDQGRGELGILESFKCPLCPERILTPAGEEDDEERRILRAQAERDSIPWKTLQKVLAVARLRDGQDVEVTNSELLEDIADLCERAIGPKGASDG